MLYDFIDINGVKYDIAVNKHGNGKPTTSTEGAVGVIYMDTSSVDNDLYKCISAEPGRYIWVKIAKGALTPEQIEKLNSVDNKLDKAGHTPNKYLGTNSRGEIVEKPVPEAGGGIPIEEVERLINEHNVSPEAHNDIRLLITQLTQKLNAFLDSDDSTLDQLSELIAAIKKDAGTIEQLTNGKVNKTDIINDLVSNVSDKPLSAAQGVELKRLIDAIEVPDLAAQVEAAQQAAQEAATQAGNASNSARTASTAAGNSSTYADAARQNAENAFSSAQTAKSEANRAQEAANSINETAVLFTPQELTPEQQKQAQKNIGVTEGGGGSKLVLKKTIEVQDGVADVQEDIKALGLEYPVIYIEVPGDYNGFGIGFKTSGGWLYPVYHDHSINKSYDISFKDYPIPGSKQLSVNNSPLGKNIDFGWVSQGNMGGTANTATAQFNGVITGIRLRCNDTFNGAKIYIMARE